MAKTKGKIKGPDMLAALQENMKARIELGPEGLVQQLGFDEVQFAGFCNGIGNQGYETHAKHHDPPDWEEHGNVMFAMGIILGVTLGREFPADEEG